MLWGTHAKAKANSTDAALHVLLSQMALVHAGFLSYSIWNPKSVVAYVLGIVLALPQGAWLITLGLYTSGMEISMHNVGAIFCLQLLAIVLVVTLVAALAVPPPAEQWEEGTPTTSAEYSKVVVDAEEMGPMLSTTSL